jgi:alpha-D-ribose 1-methylphosphonate 5-triphosphate synthase subunit PhnG
MVLIALGGEVEFAVGEVVVSVASVKTTNSIGWAHVSRFETHGAEPASLGIAAASLKLEAIIAVVVQTIDVHR